MHSFAGHHNGHRLLYALSFLLLDIITFVSATLCYTPDGHLTSDQPCNLTATASVCCEQGFLCTSNGLCQPAGWWNGENGNPLQFIRGTCTDKTWAAPECGSHCIIESVTGGEWVMECGTKVDKWCCSADNCCSNSSYEQFALGLPSITATAGVYGTSTATPISLPTTMTNSSMNATATANGTRPEVTAKATSSGYITNPSSIPSAGSSSSSSSSSGSSKTTAVGIGVGVGVGSAAVAGIVGAIIFCLRRKKQQQVIQEEIRDLSRPQYPGFDWSANHYSEPKMPPPSELGVSQRSHIQELDAGYARGTRI
ncbi:hypothetical protein NFIA_108590 [Paecilomyces variotii No. 5]|uniref:Mid2 domain-containing protein n=1 Tax=Byssochlamys spectabilis (strain No. 5 / NBRC 109023) TaxID=1356009 RepID=V5FRY0_BYSSN|nr:hypothetical protein NFIA_108590 [Paecilomyces variotii No. 5]